jgi:myosin heavy subunit
MAQLYFRVGSDWDEVLRLREECEKLETQLLKMDRMKAPEAVAALETQLASSRQKMNEMVSDAAKAGATLENDFKKKIYDASQGVNDFTQSLNKVEQAGKETFQNLVKASKVNDLTEQLKIQKQVIADLERQYVEYRAKFDELNKSNLSSEQKEARAATRKIFESAKVEIELEKKALLELEQQRKKATSELEREINARGNASKSQVSYLTQIRTIKDEMVRLTEAGQKETQRYKELEAELEKVGTAYNAVQREQQLLTTGGNATLAGLISGMSGVAGAFSAAQGAMSLFTTDNERLAAIQTKLQAAMSITIGLQQVSTVLHQTSTFRINTVAKATELWDKSLKFLNVTMGLSNTLAKGLMIGGIGLLIAGAGYLITKFQQWRKEQSEVNKLTKEVNKSTKEEVVHLQSLDRVLKNSSNNLTARKKALDELKKIMPTYNAMLDKEGNLIEDNTRALELYIKQIKKTAEAKIASEKLVASENAFDEWVSNLSKREQGILLSGNMGMLQPSENYAYEVLSKQRDKYLKDIDFWTKQLEKSQVDAFSSTGDSENKNKAHWKKIKKDAETALDSIDSAIKKKLDKGSFSGIDEKIVESYKKAQKELKEANENLSLYDYKENKSSTDANRLKSETADRLRDIEEARKKLVEQEKNGELELRQIRIDLLEEGTDKTLKQIGLDYDKRLAETAKRGEDLIKQQQEIERKVWEAENPAWKDKGMVFTPTTVSVEQLPKSGQDQLDALDKLNMERQAKEKEDLLKATLKQYQDYATQRLAIEKKFNDDLAYLYAQRDKAEKEGNGEAIEQISRAIAQATKDKGKELISFDFDVLKESPEYARAFEDLKNTSSETLNDLLSQLEGMKSEMTATLDPTELREYMNTIRDIVNELNSRNPFRALAATQKELAKSNAELARARSNLLYNTFVLR